MTSNQNNATMSQKFNYDFTVKDSGKCQIFATCSTCAYSVCPRDYGQEGVDHYYCTRYAK